MEHSAFAMNIKSERREEYQKYHDINQEDDYSKACITAGEAFMKALDEGKTCEEANRAMCDAEPGLTGFMASMALKAVAYFHQRGEEARVWRNDRNGVKSEKRIVNAAVMDIDDKGKMSPTFESV